MEKFKVIESSPSPKKVLTIREFCKMYGLGHNTAYKLAHRSDAPILRVSNKFLFIRSKVDSWMESLAGKKL
ncbi:helix-turn-helix domain-containing protein [Clostridium sp. HV4-5-A1G]|jgi:excisionase family DNA binding protein|uniref:helix-turn-helix domain-containing protein n=1 Tax=Clostridium sp. HV4-5-A1G TaxID=2004595 RepID=UPI00123B1650|nr:helix-turn-helix domain-containing protein [Clostridium sp. HV4-5-A1G]KAA8674468.1 helix-turn-helix domain-containing protein [Clostridium sp. HV4-5-A1G]